MPAAVVAAGILLLGMGACARDTPDARAEQICSSGTVSPAEPGQRMDLGALTVWIPDGWSLEDPGYFDHGGMRLGPQGELGLSNAYVGTETFGEEVASCTMSVNGLSLTIYAFDDGGKPSVAAVVGEEGDFESRMQPLLSAHDATGPQLDLFLSALHSLERGSSSYLRYPEALRTQAESKDRGEHSAPPIQ